MFINKELNRLEILNIDKDLLINATLIDMVGKSINTNLHSNYLYYPSGSSGLYILLLENKNDKTAIKVVLN